MRMTDRWAELEERVSMFKFARAMERAWEKHLDWRGTRYSWRYPAPSLNNLRRYLSLSDEFKKATIYTHDLTSVYGESWKEEVK